MVGALSSRANLIAAGFDAERLFDGTESQSSGDTVIEDLQMIILEFDYFTAVYTDEVIVRRLIQKVRVVGGLSVAEIDFLKQSCLHEQADSPVESRPRCTGVGSPELFP